MRRLAVIYINPQIVVDLLKTGRHLFEIAEGGLPQDAQVASIGNFLNKPRAGQIAIVIESDSFSEVLEGAAFLPELPPIAFKSLRPASEVIAPEVAGKVH